MHSHCEATRRFAVQHVYRRSREDLSTERAVSVPRAPVSSKLIKLVIKDLEAFVDKVECQRWDCGDEEWRSKLAPEDRQALEAAMAKVRAKMDLWE